MCDATSARTHAGMKKTWATKNREMVRVPISMPPRIIRFSVSPISGTSLAAFVPTAVAKYARWSQGSRYPLVLTVVLMGRRDISSYSIHRSSNGQSRSEVLKQREQVSCLVLNEEAGQT